VIGMAGAVVAALFILVRQALFGLLDQFEEAQDLRRRGRVADPLNLGHDLLRQLAIEKGAHVKLLPPAVQDEAAGFATRLLSAVAERHFVPEAAATREHILIVFVQHRRKAIIKLNRRQPALGLPGNS